MLAYIRGQLASASDGIIVLDVGGVGYELNVSNATITKYHTVGETVKLQTYLNVREDGVTLYGFYNAEEKNMFNLLTAISGIGPKAALSVLSGMELSSLAVAIITEDVKTLSKIKNIGKKTAERIVLELKEKISAESCIKPDGQIASPELQGYEPLDALSADAVSALSALGLSRQEALKAVCSVRKDSTTIEEIITNALKSF